MLQSARGCQHIHQLQDAHLMLLSSCRNICSELGSVRALGSKGCGQLLIVCGCSVQADSELSLPLLSQTVGRHELSSCRLQVLVHLDVLVSQMILRNKCNFNRRHKMALHVCNGQACAMRCQVIVSMCFVHIKCQLRTAHIGWIFKV